VKQLVARVLLGVHVTQPEKQLLSVSSELKVLLKLWADHPPDTTAQVLNMLTAKQEVHLRQKKKVL
jgi:hypothetical protein